MRPAGEILTLDGLARRFAATAVGGVSADTRRLAAGDAFFAMPGARDDGARFIGEARTKGAAVVIGPRGSGSDVEVDDVRLALAEAAAKFYTGQPETIVAVTGTSGKTSVASFARQIFLMMGREAASLGTIGVASRAELSTTR